MIDSICTCKDGFYLSKNNEVHTLKKEGLDFNFHNMRLLRCHKCNSAKVPHVAELACEAIIDRELKEKTNRMTDFDFERIKGMLIDEKFISSNVGFLYDKDDYYFMPGLQREWNIGFLTPVFLNLEVLLKYSYHPDYSLELGADTYGYIYNGNDHMISFGINRNGKVIMWLGDIAKLELKEQFYLRSENTSSDHDISSQFYEAQIGNIWADPSRENQLFSKRKDLHEKVLNQYGFAISQLEPETLKVASSIVKPLVSTEHAFANVIIAMNKIFVESIATKKIKSFIKENFKSVKVDNLGGLKILQLWIENCLDVTSAGAIVSPMFVLYDLRIAMAHLQSNERKEELLSSACKRLNLSDDNRNYIEIYDVLVNELKKTYDILLESDFIYNL